MALKHDSDECFVFTPSHITLENHGTRTTQSSWIGCSRRGNKIVYLADKKGYIFVNILQIDLLTC